MPTHRKRSNTANIQPSPETAPPAIDVEAIQVSGTAKLSKAPTRQGRYPSFQRPATSPDLFPDGMTDRMASNRVIWEGCNILTQGQDAGWITPEEGAAYYESPVAKGKGYVSFWVTNNVHTKDPSMLEGEAALALIDQFDIRAACMHLIYAAHATQLERPWEQQFVLSDTQLEHYLGLDKNKKLNKQQKLQLMLELAKQPCYLLVYVSWPDQGRVPMFTVSRNWLWEIAEPMLHFQDCLQDENGNLVGEKTLIGFTLNVRCGNWAKYFLNEQQRKEKTGYYEYGILSQQILQDLMTTWHHYEGAARLMTWLLFKTKINRNSPLTAEVLLKVAFGEKALQAAVSGFRERAKLVRSWITSLKVLLEKGWKIIPDPETYPLQYWVDSEDSSPLNEIPDDPDKAADFWAKDAGAKAGSRLTDRTKRMRGSFNQLLSGRLWIQPPEVIAEKLDAIEEHRKTYIKEFEPKRVPAAVLPSATEQAVPTRAIAAIQSGEQLKQMRITKGLSQVELAAKIGRSPSWIKMVESGKRKIQPQDHEALIACLT
jgi:DNA-binding XRE family transcriptional regulator